MSRNLGKAIIAWVCCLQALCYANTTLAQDVAGYDWLSLAMSLGGGLLGGAFRTIISLVSLKVAVGYFRALLVRDLIVAVAGGLVAYLMVQGYNSWAAALTTITMPMVASDFRIIIILTAGASGGMWLKVVDRFATKAVASAQQKLFGGAEGETPPAVSVASTVGDAGGVQ